MVHYKNQINHDDIITIYKNDFKLLINENKYFYDTFKIFFR